MKDTFGLRLKFFRSKAGLSQQQLADKTGLSRKIISDYEVKLDVKPRQSNLYKLANALNIDPSNLIPSTIIGDDATINEDGSIKYTFDLSEFSPEAIEYIKIFAEKKNMSIQDAFQELMIHVIESALAKHEENQPQLSNQNDNLDHKNELLFHDYLKKMSK